ncbi:hypothetical protein ARHIZOSPH14_06670 [Agromyces rhizosphaerae]|uniref:MBL fold metallo-hydrolase n=1 Tax=Agromyces rhizosphaerae TaxID=88374 RepID=A0A9W6CU41_9MICO|nr:hypothetical protein [Agromyces rhizosphaerae]GLI26425.1 hypothetical protein ARHIZOSPH14_06670 [Agromyces rhizosphaerae]
MAALGGTGPEPDEIEVSLFGPGKGEAVLVHVGAGEWITVDSCIEQRTQRHPVLDYLESIEVDVATQVKLVVGTHAHDDHIAGIGRLYAEAAEAQYLSSAAFTGREFFAAVKTDEDIEAQVGSSVRDEIRGVMEEVASRGRFPDGRAPWLEAVQQRTVWQRRSSAGAADVDVVALSPSDIAVAKARANVAAGAGSVQERKRLSAGDPNEYSVALWLEVGDIRVLLGADLTIGPVGSGWQAVADSHQPNGKASLFKVPHHGSPNAHHEATWDDLLTESVTSVVAPFRLGVNPRPNEEDVARIVARSDRAFATAKTKSPVPSKETKRTRAALAEVAQNVREAYGKVGQVRARKRSGEGRWRVELLAPAHELPLA